MSDRKYRQRGYQDEPREPRREQTPAPKKEYAPRGQPPDRPKTFSMPGFREAVRCARCGNELTVATAWSADARARGAAPTSTPARSAQISTPARRSSASGRFARESPRRTRKNTCAVFEPRTTVERETKSAAPTSARKAFDDLFK